MRRSAFTMIELIFVIVILGILAAVALPRFASIQDDANIAAEKSVIGSIRSGLQAIKGRALANSTRDVNITFMDAAGQSYFANLGKIDRLGACGNAAEYCMLETGVSFSGHPNSLSLTGWKNKTGGPSPKDAVDESDSVGGTSGEATGTQGSPAAALILEPDGRDTIQTFSSKDIGSSGVKDGTVKTAEMMPKDKTGGGLGSIIIGQATRQVADTGLELCVGKGWIYNSVSGNIVLAGTCD